MLSKISHWEKVLKQTNVGFLLSERQNKIWPWEPNERDEYGKQHNV